MNSKNLIDKKDVEIANRKFFISRIPAVQAQKIFLAGFGSMSTSSSIGSLPPAMMEELLTYCGTYNGEGAEVQFVNPEVTDMFVKDMFDLLCLEHEMVRYNFGFLFDGRGEELANRLNSILPNSQSNNA